jgi:hypothetical protein
VSDHETGIAAAEIQFYTALIGAEIVPQTYEELRGIGAAGRRKLDAILDVHTRLVAEAVKAARIAALVEARNLILTKTEATILKTGERILQDRYPGDLVSTAYAVVIQARIDKETP